MQLGKGIRSGILLHFDHNEIAPLSTFVQSVY